MNRRSFLRSGLGIAWVTPVIANVQRGEKLDAAADVLARATTEGQMHAAVLCVRHREGEFVRSFGAARSPEALFLLGSISMLMAAGAPREDIVLGFHPARVRQLTEFAVG